MKFKRCVLAVLTGGFIVLSGCADKNYITERNDEYITVIEGAQVFSKVITIEQANWSWNKRYDRFEVYIDDPDLAVDETLYDEGFVSVTVLLDERDSESGELYQTQKTLSCDQTLKKGDDFITVKISAHLEDHAKVDGGVGLSFFIENENLKEGDQSILDDLYMFKVLIIWDELAYE